MSRVVLIGQDLRGRTLDGPAREALILNCPTDIKTRFVGDWRGGDFLGLTGPADWSKAQTFAARWTGNLRGSRFPPDLGWIHLGPPGEILRQHVESIGLSGSHRVALNEVTALVDGSKPLLSWRDTRTAWWDGMNSDMRGRIKGVARDAFAPYPRLARHFERLIIALETGDDTWGRLPHSPFTVTIVWDGATVKLDTNSLPVLSEPSRYALRKWVGAEADAQVDGEHHCFVYSFLPMIAEPLSGKDSWLVIGKEGY